MSTPLDDLRHSVAGFRRARARLHLAALAGRAEPDPWLERELYACLRPDRLAAYGELRGELAPESHASLGAHLLRAWVERDSRRAQAALSRHGQRPMSMDAGSFPLAQQWAHPANLGSGASRTKLLNATERALSGLGEDVARFRAQAGSAAAAALRELAPGRHPDAGPEQGSADDARAFLDDSDDLLEASLTRLRALTGNGLNHVADLAAAGRDARLLPLGPERRGQRIGELWRGLGLRDVLNRSVRLGPAHAGAFPAAGVVVEAPVGSLFLVPPVSGVGLLSELAMLEASGRAIGFASVSKALPFELRFPAVASVARALGQLAVLAFVNPSAYRRHYDAGRDQAVALAQATAAFVLVRARARAAAALSAGLGPEDLSALASRALGVHVPSGVAFALLTRVSPGGDARACMVAPGIAAALRDAFDEDWFRNPRTREPIEGACMRGGALSAEAFAEELSATQQAGLSLLAEVF